MPPPASHRRALLVAGIAMAMGSSRAGAGAPHGLARWQPRMPLRLQTTDLSGQPRTLADFAGQALILNFWATWCAPCRLELPALNAAADRLAPQGLRLLAINHGEMPERVRRFLDEVPIHGTVLLDRSQTQLRAWGARGLPSSFVLDAQGRPRYMAWGEIDWGAAQVMEALQQVVAG